MAQPCWAASSGSALEVAYRNQIRVANGAFVGGEKTDQGLRLTRRQHELDLKTVGCMKVDNRAEIATAQAVLGKVPIQDDCVEQVEHVYPGYAVTK